ncbi:MAG: metallophosphoesterase family protein, partial [Terriglobales bacterium]
MRPLPGASMRIAALYDIHANYPALRAVVAKLGMEGVDAVVIGGDALPGPQPGATFDCLRSLPWPTHFRRAQARRWTGSANHRTGKPCWPASLRLNS